MTYTEFFQQAFQRSRAGSQAPYAYQCRLAGGPQAAADGAFCHGTSCQSQLINIPTGLGKTAGVVLAWLWNRVCQPDTSARSRWPRRLVYCLPMRTLVEQTEGDVRKWLGDLLWNGQHADRPGKVGVHVLMGGEDAGEWDIYPEENAILIGTQDMLLSRALNRGYGMSRYRWPMHFGLLNNDCLWVMDETQLMGPGLGTACQLEAFRTGGEQGFGAYGSGSVTWYMSATNNPEYLRTREWRNVNRPMEFAFGLTAGETAATSGPVHQRRFAVKSLELCKDTSFENAHAAKALATRIRERHEAMLQVILGDPKLPARTLVICNTVDRAKTAYALLTAERPDDCDFVLLHSRFRPPERKAQMDRLSNINRAAFPKGQIVVSTQVIEAGVDVSSGILWSEVAPLASLVQRLGRLNRAGEFNEGEWEPQAIIVGVGEQDEIGNTEAKKRIRDDNNKRCMPYESDRCAATWGALKLLNKNASAANLETIRSDISASISRCPYSLQRHELLDFFDTDANLSLGFTDVSPFVRGLDDDTDLQVLWRQSWLQRDGEEGIGEPGFTPDFQRDELCSLPIGKALNAREVLNRGWLWRGKESGWISVRDAGLAPGMAILLPCEAGGYDHDAGWTGEKTDNKHAPHYKQNKAPTDEEQLSSLTNGWQSIEAHTGFVAQELSYLLRHLLTNDGPDRNALTLAVPWHDIGKNHPRWQEAVVEALGRAGITGKGLYQPFAKFSLSESPSLAGQYGDALARRIRELNSSFRPGVAHEVASALAFRQAEQKRLGPARDTDLVSLLAEYVIMSHHGRVRKVLRDEIPRLPSAAKDTNAVRGVSEGDPLPAVVIEGQALGCDSLSTDCRRMGRGANGHESYTRGVLRLLEHYGPFRLAFFEALFRVADICASINATHKTNA